MAMKRVGGWLNPSKGSLPSSKSLTAIDEPHACMPVLTEWQRAGD